MESKEEHIMDAEMEDAEEVFAFSYDDGDDGDDGRFSQIVGALEDIIMMPSFSELQNTFCEKHCHHFEDTEENKLVYTELHERYVGVMEEVSTQWARTRWRVLPLALSHSRTTPLFLTLTFKHGTPLHAPFTILASCSSLTES